MDVHRLKLLKIAIFFEPGAFQVCWDCKLQNPYSTESKHILNNSQNSLLGDCAQSTHV